MDKILKSIRTVRFQHCDPYSVLYNARYLDYFMNAREDQVLENYGVNIYDQLKSTGTAWVVGQNKISYFAPATLMERVMITSKIINYSNKTLTVECVMYDEHEAHVKAVLWATFINYDVRAQKSTPIDDQWRTLFDQVLFPITQPDFDLRCKEIRAESVRQTV